MVNSQEEWRMLLFHLIWSMAGERFKQLNGTTLVVGCLDSCIKSSLMLAVAVSWIPIRLSISTQRCQFPGLFQCLLILILSIRHVLWIQNERKEPTKPGFWRTSGSWLQNRPVSKRSSFAIVNSLAACGRFPLACCCTSSLFLDKRTSLAFIKNSR